MKRMYQAILMMLVIPLVSFFVLYFVCKAHQPEILYVDYNTQRDYTSYLSYEDIYELVAECKAFPGKILSVEDALNTDGSILIDSITDAKSSDFLVDGSYKGTLCFSLKLPSYTKFCIRFPATFCEYNIYVNGIKVASSPTFGKENPVYPREFFATLPANATGKFDVVMTFISPKNYVNTAGNSVMIGEDEHLRSVYGHVDTIGLIILSFIIFTIIFTFIHVYILKSDKRIVAFILMSFMVLFVTGISDGRTLLNLFPYLPYQLGCFIEAFAAPLYLLSLLYLTHAMFPDYFSERIGKIFAILLIIPAANALCLGQFKVLSLLTTAVTIIPYAMCLYVFVLAYEGKLKQSMFYGFGVLAMEISVLLDYATRDMAISAHYEYSAGYIIMSVMMVAIIAREYSTQISKEAYITNELSRKLVDMQASENAFLNAQMKPHFLYNTLNTIADCCVTDSMKAKKLINSLSEYLKLILNLDNMDKTVPLSRELELVEAYTAIEKERFPSINFYNDFPIRLPVVSMPPITIQPLIENAIKHGVRKSDKPGAVTLRIVEHPDCVEFFVSDNGVGMTEDTINNLFKVPKENQSIGIYNIDKRLKNIYKKGLKVESTPGLGTCVSFTVMKY